MSATTVGNEVIIRTACSSHCGGRCILEVHVKDGVITRIETDRGKEPQLRACLRCRAYRQRIYDPDRLLYPLRRIGARGEGRFVRISWDEALDMIAAQLQRIRNEYGPASVLLLGGGGDATQLHTAQLLGAILAMSGGYTARWGVHSFEGGLFASLATYGTLASHNSFDDLLNSRLVIMWGWDPLATIHETNTSWYLLQAKEAGTRFVAVDPRYTDSAALLAERWIPIRPGTDTAVLVSMAYVMICEDLYDQAFVDRYTHGFERFRDYVLGESDATPKTPTWAEAISGVPARDIEWLARAYAQNRPSALVAGIAPGRTAYGEQYHRAAKTLAAMTGNIGIHGGWAGRSSAPQPQFGGYALPLGRPLSGITNPVERDCPARSGSLPTLSGSDSMARIHTAEVADAILKGKKGGYPADIKMAIVMHTNPVNQYPNTNKMVAALKKLEFLCVAEQVMSATAKFADVILPVSTCLERNDITLGGVRPLYAYIKKVVEPPGEAKSPLEICAGLARRLGITLLEGKTDEDWLRAMVAESLIPDYETFKEEAVYRVDQPQPHVAFKEEIADLANHPFPTPSGKIEIYSETLAAMRNPDIPPIPTYIEPWEGPRDPLTSCYPLQLITTHSQRRAHTQFDKVPWLRELIPQACVINRRDAEARGIKDGDLVRVFNDRGEVLIRARVTERIMPGVVDIPQGAWYDPDPKGVDRGGCANCLTSDRRSPAGALCYNTALVEVAKVDQADP